MAPPPSLPFRNVFVFSKGEEIAGFWQHGNVSKRRFREWLEYCWYFEQGGSPVAGGLVERCDPANVQERCVIGPSNGNLVAEEAMPTGTFEVLSDGNQQPVDHVLTPHVYHRRTITPNSSSSSSSKSFTFTDRIRARDQKCLITGERPFRGRFRPLRAAHIFARAHIDRWRAHGHDRFVEDKGHPLGDAKIDSIQNGLLLRSDLHANFNDHRIAVDVDNGYTIFDFSPTGIHGSRLDLDHLDPGSSERPLDALLRDHFWQAILANVRGPSEVYDEKPDDDWSNSDTLRMENDALHKTEAGRLRLELELGSRLNHLVT